MNQSINQSNLYVQYGTVRWAWSEISIEAASDKIRSGSYEDFVPAPPYSFYVTYCTTSAHFTVPTLHLFPLSTPPNHAPHNQPHTYPPSLNLLAPYPLVKLVNERVTVLSLDIQYDYNMSTSSRILVDNNNISVCVDDPSVTVLNTFQILLPARWYRTYRTDQSPNRPIPKSIVTSTITTITKNVNEWIIESNQKVASKIFEAKGTIGSLLTLIKSFIYSGGESNPRPQLC